MPIRHNAATSMIAAFQAGRDSALQKQQRATEEEQRKIDNADRKAARDEQIRQFEESASFEKERFTKTQEFEKLQNEIARIAASQKAAELFTEKGISSPGDTVETPTYSQGRSASEGKHQVNFSPVRTDLTGLEPGTARIKNPILGDITVPTHEAYVERQIKDQEAIQGPLRVSQAAKDAAAFQIKEIELKAAKKTKEEDYANSVAMNNARIASREKIAFASGKTVLSEAEKNDMRPLSNIELENFGTINERGIKTPLQAGTTFGQIRGRIPLRALSPQQETYLSSLHSLEDLLLEAKKTFEGSGNQPGYGYGNFFKGVTPSGIYASVAQKVSTTDKDAEISRLFNDIILKAKEAERLGAALAGNENTYLIGTAPSSSRTVTAAAAKANVNGYLKSIQSTRNNFLSVAIGKITPSQIGTSQTGTSLAETFGAFAPKPPVTSFNLR